MGKLFTILAAVLLTAGVFLPREASAQSPEKMSYQAVISDASNNLITDTEVGMQISILQGSASGTAVYTQTQTPTTNANGLVSIEIGTGTTSDDFTSIDWANGPYFIQTKTDPAGVTDYTITGTSQLLSVPYAMHAKTAQTVTSEITETDPVFESSPSSDIQSIDISNWKEAHTWGDHSQAGYVTNFEESDPVFSSWDKSSGILISESQISDLGSYLETETGGAFTTNFDFTDVANGVLLQFDGSKFVKFTPDYISDYTVTESDVTAHQSAILITESQVTDLQTYITSENDPEFTAWDKSTGITVTESQISDLGSYLETETDPVYSGSQAANITATDITNLGNLSGTNTGDQDLSSLATKTALGDSTAQVRSEIPAAADGSETKVTAGTNVTVTGSGTTASPYVVNASSGATTYSVGDFAQGGIVFWVDETGQHGLVCAKEDQGTGVRWYAGTYGMTQAKGDGPYAGQANTSIIIAAQVAIGDGGSTYAARICNELQITEGGKTYGDWYLPSKEELNLMYQNKATIDATATSNGGSGFASACYWTSTEYNNAGAWQQDFLIGPKRDAPKSGTVFVRAVRAF